MGTAVTSDRRTAEGDRASCSHVSGLTAAGSPAGLMEGVAL